jgi:tRNA(Ile)-lysidine synthase
MMVASAAVAARVASMPESIPAGVMQRGGGPYTGCGMATHTPQLNWTRHFFRAGERVAVAVSGGADSVALLVAMADSRAETGIVLSAIHVHHGLRGAEADGDAQFVAELAKQLDVPLCTRHGDVAALAVERGQGIEEAARALRYGSFQELLARQQVDTVATAHILDDQAETVLMKMLRGAWTEGLGGIAPMVTMASGRIVRPLLETTRAEIVEFLKGRGQSWREDSTNREVKFTRNRVRYTLLPQLREFQPRIAEQLSRMAAVARDEEAWWARELARVMPGMVLPGKPVRGGGRANSTRPGEAGIAIELDRLRVLHPALQRRVLRGAAEQLGSALSFDQTEALRALTGLSEHVTGKRGRVELGAGLTGERTARELRLVRAAERTHPPLPELVVPVPGVLEAVEYGYRVITGGSLPGGATLLLRTPQPGDQVRLAHSRGAKTVKEVLERRGLSAAERRVCPVLAIGSGILWMSGVEVEWTPGLQVAVEPFGESEGPPVPQRASDAT